MSFPRFVQQLLLLAALLLSPEPQELPVAPKPEPAVSSGLRPAPPVARLLSGIHPPKTLALRPGGKTPTLSAPHDEAPLPEPARDVYDFWRRWQRLVEQRAYQQMPIINASLADALRGGEGGEIYREIGAFLRDPRLSFEVRTQLLDLLGEIATPEALALLLETAGQGMESPLYAPALNTLGHIGENRWGERTHEELSPLLEEVWKVAGGHDWPYLVALTQAIVGIGAPSGVALLLETLAGGTPNPNESNRGKQVAVFTEIPKLTNPASVPVLRQAVFGTDTSIPPTRPDREEFGATLMQVPEIPVQLPAPVTEPALGLVTVENPSPANFTESMSPDPATSTPMIADTGEVAGAEPSSPEIGADSDPTPLAFSTEPGFAPEKFAQIAPEIDPEELGRMVNTRSQSQPALLTAVQDALEGIGTQEALITLAEIRQAFPESNEGYTESVPDGGDTGDVK